MKKVIWGASLVGKRQLFALGKDKTAFIIDSDPKKSGYYNGVKIVTPDEVDDWNDLFIFIPRNFYQEIAGFLIGKGLVENVNFKGYYKELYISEEQIISNYKDSIEKLIRFSSGRKKGLLVIAGIPVIEQCRKWFKNNDCNMLSFCYINESYWKDTELMSNEDMLLAPMVFDDTTIVDGGKLSVDQKEVIENDLFFKEIVEQLMETFDGVDRESCYVSAWYQWQYAKMVVKFLKPRFILCSNVICTPHMILKKVCEENDVPIVFTHQGVFHGTYPFDIGGEMGASLPAIYWKQFHDLSVTSDELEEASKIWAYMYTSKVNRRFQPQYNIEYIKERLKKGRPTIFFAGVSDIGSHMIPYTDDTRKYHSPIFRSSTEAAIYLAKVCAKNDWNFIYKPHPEYIKPEQAKLLPHNAIFLEIGDINELIDIADVTVTILSATSYNALIRYKPVVMLGYTQLRGKGCTYEAFEKDKIEEAINEALGNGFTQKQQEEFLLHIAQCMKYYLYDDLQDRPIHYGRPVPKSIDEFYELERLLKAE